MIMLASGKPEGIDPFAPIMAVLDKKSIYTYHHLLGASDCAKSKEARHSPPAALIVLRGIKDD
jgi:hypothetical protein